MSMTHLGVAAALIAGVGIGYGFQAANPQESNLQANLYMQNSAEYRAVCLQTYSWAEAILRLKLHAAKAAMERDHSNKPLAIVMDLDETVVDNSSFESYLDRESKPYVEADWQRHEQNPSDLKLVPGAKAFIDAANALGVKAVYISNRWAKNQAFTVEGLKLNGINVDGIEHRMLLREDGQSSDKTERRQLAEKLYNVLMYFGDNLRDFSEEFAAPTVAPNDYPALQKAVEARKAQVDKRADKWGGDWIVLPNPVYGEFDKLRGADGHKMLRPSTLK